MAIRRWSTIDMEAGVFSYSEQSIAESSWKAEVQKKQEGHSGEASQEQESEGNSSGNEVKPINYQIIEKMSI